MRKNDIFLKVAEETGVHKIDVMIILESFMKEVKSSLIAGEPVFVRGFGSFILKKHRAKTGRNIKKNIAVPIPEHFVPFFKPAKEFKDTVKSSATRAE